MTKLLNKTLRYYSLFAITLLLCSGPFFYWLSEKLYLDDVDEAIILRKREFFQNNMHALREQEVATWNRFNRDIHILPYTTTSQKETIFQKTFFDTLYQEWEPYRILYSDVKIEGKPYTLMIRLNLVESKDLIQTIGVLYLIILSVLLAGFVLVSRFVSRTVWKPFYFALATIEKFNIDKTENAVFSKTKIKEFHLLNTALENLIEQNHKAYQTQKQFTQNAAHELQTPLAVFQSKLDLLLQEQSLTQPQSVILQSLYDAASRLSRINKNLLLLAKIENNQFVETTTFSINDLITEALPYFKEQAEQKKLLIDVSNKKTLTVGANKGLTEIMVNNLLLNAIRHNKENGSISILISDRQLTISNSACNKGLNPNEIFQRFGKTSDDAYSSGLGLSIVKEICDRYNWQVRYSYSNELHFFTVQF